MLKSYSVIKHNFTKNFITDTLYIAIDTKMLWDGEIYIVTTVAKRSDEHQASYTKTKSFLNEEEAVKYYNGWM